MILAKIQQGQGFDCAVSVFQGGQSGVSFFCSEFTLTAWIVLLYCMVGLGQMPTARFFFFNLIQFGTRSLHFWRQKKLI